MAIIKPISQGVVATVAAPQSGGSTYVLQTVQANLQNYYLPNYKTVIEDQSHPLLTKIEAMDKTNYKGNVAVGLMDLGVASGAGTSEGTTGMIETISDSRHDSVNYLINGKNFVLNTTIGQKAAIASQGAGAWYDETVSQLDKAQKAHVNHKATSVYAAAAGVFGDVKTDATTTAATTLDVTVHNGNRFIQGMGLAVVVKSTGLAKDAEFQNLKVIKKRFTRAVPTNEYEAVITIARENGAAFTAAKVIAAATDGFTFKFAGTKASEFTGIKQQLDTKTGDIFNLDRTNYYFQGQESSASSLLDDQEIRRADDLAADAGGDYRDILLGNRAVVAGYEATLQGQRQFTPANYLTGGVEVLSFDGKGFYKDAKSDLNTLYGIDSSTWERVDMTGGLKFADWDGGMFNKLQGKFGYEVSAFEVQELFCSVPSHNFLITGIDNG